MIKPIYLDHAATTPIDKKVLVAMQPYLADRFYNPSALYTPARRVRQDYERARAGVAKILGAKPGEIIFTAGATEANNLALFGVVARYKGTEILASKIEHDSITEPLKYLARHGWKAKSVPVANDGIVDPNRATKAVSDRTVLIIIQYANNEIGTIQPLAKIAQAVQAIRRDRLRRRVKLPLLLHSDASQAPNYLDLKVSRLEVDLMTLNGGKIYGPKQSGCLYVRGGIKLEPLMFGGGQERGLRSGTENVAANIGFAKALAITQQLKDKEAKRLATLQDQLFSGLLKIDGVNINGDRTKRLPNNVNVSIKDVSGETLVHYLDQAGILAATGAACSANKDAVSPTLLSIGLNKAASNSSLRLTMGRSTRKADIDYTIKKLAEIIERLRRR